MWQYIVLLGAVIAVAALVLPRKKKEPEGPAGSLGKMELALEQFMENMEHDNKDLAELVAEALKQADERADRQASKISELERAVAELKQTVEHTGPAVAEYTAVPVQSVTYQAVEDRPESDAAGERGPELQAEGQPDLEIQHKREERNVSIQARYAELFELYQQGKSVETIAKRLNMNKGEVQLILQLAKQEAVRHG